MPLERPNAWALVIPPEPSASFDSFLDIFVMLIYPSLQNVGWYSEPY